MGKFSHPQNDILMIVNTLAKTPSTPKEQDIEMPLVHEKGQKCEWEHFYTSTHEKVTIGGKKCKLTGIYAESDDFRFAQSTASVMTPGSKIAALPGSNPRQSSRR